MGLLLTLCVGHFTARFRHHLNVPTRPCRRRGEGVLNKGSEQFDRLAPIPRPVMVAGFLEHDPVDRFGWIIHPNTEFLALLELFQLHKIVENFAQLRKRDPTHGARRLHIDVDAARLAANVVPKQVREAGNVDAGAAGVRVNSTRRPEADEALDLGRAIFEGLGAGLAGLGREAQLLVAALFPVGRLTGSAAVPHAVAPGAHVHVACLCFGLAAIAALEAARALFHVFFSLDVGCVKNLRLLQFS